MKIPAFSTDYQRMWDLVRYERGALLDAGLITREEYAALVSDETADRPGQGSPSARRLESYDELRAKLSAAHQEIERLRERERTLREALADTTAMCRSAATWPADDTQGMRFHALEAAKRGAAALSPASPAQEDR